MLMTFALRTTATASTLSTLKAIAQNRSFAFDGVGLKSDLARLSIKNLLFLKNHFKKRLRALESGESIDKKELDKARDIVNSTFTPKLKVPHHFPPLKNRGTFG